MAKVSRKHIPSGISEKETVYSAGIYERLSDEDMRDAEDNSIGNQHKICLNYLNGRSDIQMTDTYIDNGFSGGNFKRPEFQRLLRDIDAGRINCIIVKDLSRFGRNFIETSEYLEKIFPMKGVRFIAVNNRYDNIGAMGGKEGIAIPFSNMINEIYLKDTSRKIRSSIRLLMEKGEFLPSAGSIPYGYLRDEENCTYKIDEEAAKVVCTIFQKKADGCSNCSIAAYLNELHIPSPGKLRFMRGMSRDKRFETALWTHGAIRDILKNEAYIGHRIYGKVRREHIGEPKTNRKQEEWKYIYHAHPEIIEKDLFQRVKNILEDENKKREKRNRHKAVPSDKRELFWGKVFCGDCGSLMSAMKRDQRLTSSLEPKIFYQCNGYVYSGMTKCCNHYLSQEKLCAVVKRAIQTQVQVAADLERMGKVRLFCQETDDEVKRQQDIIYDIKRKQRKKEGQLELLLDHYNSGVLDKGEFLYIKGKYETESEMMSEQLKIAEQDLETVKEKADRKKEWLSKMDSLCEKIELNRAFIDCLIEKVLIYKDKSVEIVFRFKDEYEQAADIVTKGVS